MLIKMCPNKTKSCFDIVRQPFISLHAVFANSEFPFILQPKLWNYLAVYLHFEEKS